MRELEFLPDWYGNVRRRRAWVLVQAWSTGALFLVLLVWTCVAHFRAASAQREQGQVTALVTRSQKDVDELHLLEMDKTTWRERGEVLEKIGLAVESTRLLGTIAAATPATVALSSFSLQTEEKQEVLRSAAAARALKDKAPGVDRRLRIRITGIAPSDAEVWDLATKLTAYSFFDDVSTPSLKDADYEGRLVREFEMSFSVDLNAPATN